MEEQASGRQAHQRVEVVDASEKLRFECQVYESCGMQQGLGNRLMAEQNHQARGNQWSYEGAAKNSGGQRENVA
eukprot:10191138-Prorocentrum_lima.AAC.1